MLNAGKPEIQDAEMEHYIAGNKLNLKATTDAKIAYENTNIVIIATPTNYDGINNFFDTSTVESIIDDILSLDKDIPIFY